MTKSRLSLRVALLSMASFAGTLVPSSLWAENRVALVIGNASYLTVPLINPANDARVITDLLQQAGFEVTPASDLTQSDMRRAIGDFAAKVRSKGTDTVAVVYYAGHGVQVGGENFLIPIDARIGSEAEVALQGVRFDDLMNALEAVPTKARIVILDACRNNPFEAMKKTVGRGLAMVNAPVGSVVAYSTSPGTEAEDGEGGNSPFTSAFVAAAKRPGVPVEQIFKDTRLAVHTATSGRQTPWEVLSLTANFSFFPAGAAVVAATTPAAPSQPASANTQPTQSPSAPTQSSTQPQPVADRPAVTKASLVTKDPEQISDKPAVRSAYWNKRLRALGQPRAYDVVVQEDNVDAYREYLVLYPKAPNVSRVRVIVDRRTEMLAWYTATTANSVASYKYFLARYGASDMAPTARGLLNRAATRALLASTDPAALGLSVAPPCNCSTPPARRAEPKPAPTKRAARNTGRPSGPAREVVEVEDAPPPRPVGIGVGTAIGIGTGIGIGLGGGGGYRPPMGGGGGGYRPPSGMQSGGSTRPMPTPAGRH